MRPSVRLLKFKYQGVSVAESKFRNSVLDYWASYGCSDVCYSQGTDAAKQVRRNAPPQQC